MDLEWRDVNLGHFTADRDRRIEQHVRNVTQCNAMRVLTFTSSERQSVMIDCVALRARHSRNELIPVPVPVRASLHRNDVTDTCSSSVSTVSVYVKHSQSLQVHNSVFNTNRHPADANVSTVYSYFYARQHANTAS